MSLIAKFLRSEAVFPTSQSADLAETWCFAFLELCGPKKHESGATVIPSELTHVGFRHEQHWPFGPLLPLNAIQKLFEARVILKEGERVALLKLLPVGVTAESEGVTKCKRYPPRQQASMYGGFTSELTP